MAKWIWSIRKDNAARLVAWDILTNDEIGKAVGIAPRTLGYWKRAPEFQERVSHYVRELAEQNEVNRVRIENICIDELRKRFSLPGKVNIDSIIRLYLGLISKRIEHKGTVTLEDSFDKEFRELLEAESRREAQALAKDQAKTRLRDTKD